MISQKVDDEKYFLFSFEKLIKDFNNARDRVMMKFSEAENFLFIQK